MTEVKQIRSYGTLYLSGGGSADQTSLIDTFFADKILPKNRISNILYIPVAKTTDNNGYKKSLKWVIDKFKSLNKDNLKFVLATNLGKIKDLQEYDAIYIGGGNTYKLLYQSNKSGFTKLLLSYIEDGGIVYGASAGAVIFGRKISTYIEDKYLDENEKYSYTNEEGFSLLAEYTILTHFEDGDENKVTNFFQNHSDPIIVIPTGTALVVDKVDCYAVGNKLPVVYLNRLHRIN